MSGIRVMYTGLLSFLGGIIAIVTGSLFLLIITRTLTIEEYGSWGLIFSLISSTTMLTPIFGYWSTRETSRKILSGKTALLSTTALSALVGIVFVFASFFVSNETGINQNDFIFASILIIPMFLNGILYSIALGYKPHVLSFSSILFGLTQIFSVLIFVYFLDLGISGIILSLLISYIVSIIVLILYVYEKIKNPFKKEFLKKWLKFFWIPLYPSIYNILAESTILIFTIMTGSIVGVAYWVVSGVLVSSISASGLISKAVYPKLLGLQDRSFLRDNITYLFYFGLLFSTLVITFARPGLFLLNPVYVIAVPIVIILAIEGFLTVLTNMFQLTLIGIEKIDTYSNSTTRDYLKSKLFYVYTLRLIQVIVYVILLIIGLLILLPSSNSNIDLLMYWATVALITQIPLVILLGILIKRNFINPFDFKKITKFFVVSIITYVIFNFLVEQSLVFTENIYQFLPNLLLYAFSLIGMYLIITYLIDSKIKTLFNSIIQVVVNKIGK
jgi:O-antigen/teichoic acid export membrane protein